MSVASWPRISLAKDLLPVVRAHLVAAASHHSIPAGLALDLVPIVEDGLVGYEILPNHATHTYLTIGCDDRGVPVLRESSYSDGPTGVLRVASVNGRTLTQGGKNAGRCPRQRDFVLPDWPSTAEAVWTRLAALFPQQPRHCIEVHGAWQDCLDQALAITYAHLAECDPCIDFCGVPGEDQYGYALVHANGGRGLLTSREPGKWSLWFRAPNVTLSEEWAMALPGLNVADAWASAGATARYTTRPITFPYPSLLAPTARRTRGERLAERPLDRVDGDRRRADRRHADTTGAGGGYDDERRHRDRRQWDRARTAQRGS